MNTMTTPDNTLSTIRFLMTRGEVDDASQSLVHLWSTLPADGRPEQLIDLHGVTLELADRFPLSESVSSVLYHATFAYAQAEDFSTATVMAKRMVAVWRARCQAGATVEALKGHLHALDTLAGVFRARGMTGAIGGCLVELIEWHFNFGNSVGVAWALRELGALAFLSGDLDNAVSKLTRADEIYAEEADEPSVAEERAECHVLMARVLLARGDDDSAQQWLDQAVNFLTGDAAAEARLLREAVRAGEELPAPVVLVVGEFGLPAWKTSADHELTPAARAR
jgi:hypothetical protein